MDKLAKLYRDGHGAAAVEFAIAAPVFILLMVGGLELVLTLFVGAMLEGAVLEASRYGATGAAIEGKTREERILEIIGERTLGLIDMDYATIETLVYPSFSAIGKEEPYTDENGDGKRNPGEPFNDINGNGTWDPDPGLTGAGGPGDIVLYRVSYSWGAITDYGKKLFGTFRHQAAVAVRNEPYDR